MLKSMQKNLINSLKRIRGVNDMERRIHLSIQMVLAGILTTLIAYFLELQYWQTSGVIAVLSINYTKKDTIKVAFNRLKDVVLALGLSTLLFYMIGYNLSVYLVFMVIFIVVSWVLNISEGIVVSLVLINHIWPLGHFDSALLLNEVYIFLLALVIALSINLLYPNYNLKKLDKNMALIDQYIQEHTFMLSLVLKDIAGYPIYKEHYNKIVAILDPLIIEADLLRKDQVLKKNYRYAEYLHMRKRQLEALNRMYDLTIRMKSSEPIIDEIAAYVKDLCYDIGSSNKAVEHLIKLEKYHQELETRALPKSRNEFITRAVLYQFLEELKIFLTEKTIFHQNFDV